VPFEAEAHKFLISISPLGAIAFPSRKIHLLMVRIIKALPEQPAQPAQVKLWELQLRQLPNR